MPLRRRLSLTVALVALLVVVAAAVWLGRITSVSHVLCSALGVVVLLVLASIRKVRMVGRGQRAAA